MMFGCAPGRCSATTAFRPPPVRHVWIIDLANESFGFSFGTTGQRRAPYLARTLPTRARC
jgi:hypothetical protein